MNLRVSARLDSSEGRPDQHAIRLGFLPRAATSVHQCVNQFYECGVKYTKLQLIIAAITNT